MRFAVNIVDKLKIVAHANLGGTGRGKQSVVKPLSAAYTVATAVLSHSGHYDKLN